MGALARNELKYAMKLEKGKIFLEDFFKVMWR